MRVTGISQGIPLQDSGEGHRDFVKCVIIFADTVSNESHEIEEKSKECIEGGRKTTRSDRICGRYGYGDPAGTRKVQA